MSSYQRIRPLCTPPLLPPRPLPPLPDPTPAPRGTDRPLPLPPRPRHRQSPTPAGGGWHQSPQQKKKKQRRRRCTGPDAKSGNGRARSEMDVPSLLGLGLGPAHAARVAALAALPVVREVTEDACRDLPEVRGGGRGRATGTGSRGAGAGEARARAGPRPRRPRALSVSDPSACFRPASVSGAPARPRAPSPARPRPGNAPAHPLTPPPLETTPFFPAQSDPVRRCWAAALCRVVAVGGDGAPAPADARPLTLSATLAAYDIRCDREWEVGGGGGVRGARARGRTKTDCSTPLEPGARPAPCERRPVFCRQKHSEPRPPCRLSLPGS